MPSTGRAARRRAAEAESVDYNSIYPPIAPSNGFPPSPPSASNGISNGPSAGLTDANKPSWATGYSWGHLTGPNSTNGASVAPRSDENGAATDRRDWSDLGGGHRSDYGNDYGTGNGTGTGTGNDYGTGNGTGNGNGWPDFGTTRGPGPAAVDGRGRADLGGRPSGPADRDRYRGNGAREQETWSGLPPLGGRQEPFAAPALSDGPSTEQFARLDGTALSAPVESAPLGTAAAAPVDHPAIQHPPVEHASVEQVPGPPPTTAFRPATAPVEPAPTYGRQSSRAEGPPAGLGASTQAMPRQEPDDLIDEDPDFTAYDDAPDYDLAVDPEDDVDADEYASPVREWAVMATQIGVGVIGGAGLWLILEWLWQRIPVVALVVALAVITGLVWVVRRVRKAEDLQTTVIAVLVGLFVTVSPAALLLVGR
jgi:hypothetical protein